MYLSKNKIRASGPKNKKDIAVPPFLRRETMTANHDTGQSRIPWRKTLFQRNPSGKESQPVQWFR